MVSGVFSVVCTALFLRFVWHPKQRFLLRSERDAAGNGTAAAPEWKYKYGVGETIHAWMPWAILIACCVAWGLAKTWLETKFEGGRHSRRVAKIDQEQG